MLKSRERTMTGGRNLSPSDSLSEDYGRVTGRKRHDHYRPPPTDTTGETTPGGNRVGEWSTTTETWWDSRVSVES